jgi:hypothetical protein
MIIQGNNIMSEAPRKSSGCENIQSNINGVVIVTLMILGALAIMFALSMLFTAGTYNNFVWDATTYPTWQFIISIIVGIGALIIAIWLAMKGRGCK